MRKNSSKAAAIAQMIVDKATYSFLKRIYMYNVKYCYNTEQTVIILLTLSKVTHTLFKKTNWIQRIDFCTIPINATVARNNCSFNNVGLHRHVGLQIPTKIEIKSAKV